VFYILAIDASDSDYNRESAGSASVVVTKPFSGSEREWLCTLLSMVTANPILFVDCSFIFPTFFGPCQFHFKLTNPPKKANLFRLDIGRSRLATTIEDMVSTGEKLFFLIPNESRMNIELVCQLVDVPCLPWGKPRLSEPCMLLSVV